MTTIVLLGKRKWAMKMYFIRSSFLKIFQYSKYFELNIKFTVKYNSGMRFPLVI